MMTMMVMNMMMAQDSICLLTCQLLLARPEVETAQ